MSDTITNIILTSTNTTYIIFKFIIYMCWRDSILGKFQLSGFFFFNRINPIFIPFRVSSIFKTKTKKPRSTITYNEDLDEEQKRSFFSFSFIYYYYYFMFLFKIHLSHSNQSYFQDSS